jgi:hypothetical protein
MKNLIYVGIACLVLGGIGMASPAGNALQGTIPVSDEVAGELSGGAYHPWTMRDDVMCMEPSKMEPDPEMCPGGYDYPPGTDHDTVHDYFVDCTECGIFCGIGEFVIRCD